MGLVGSLLRQAGRDPERIALADSVGRSVSYAHLALAVGIGAGRLRDAGIGPGDRVLLCLPNGFDFVRAYYSVIAAGAIAVPVSPQLPVGDVERVVDDCQPSAAIAAPDAAVFGPKVRLTCADLTCNEAENEDGARYAAARARSAMGVLETAAARTEQGPAVILYTSGTTGEPKGAMLSGEALAANAEAMGEVSSSRPEDIHLCALPLHHSFGATVSMNMPIATGGRIVFSGQFVPIGVAKLIGRARVTVWAGVPAMFAAMAVRADVDRCDLESLRMCISGGAALSGRILRAFHERFGIEIAEGYGLTEASPVVTATRAGDLVVAGAVGPPIPGVCVRIVDELGGDAAPGSAGEVCVSGPGVMLGYHGRPWETSQVLHDGWLRTGDMGFVDERGYLRILDRQKDIINTSGYKVYPAEVEETIRQHPAVDDAVVIGQPHPVRGEVVAAHVQLKPGARSTSERELILFCRRRLANYKAPACVIIHEALPVNEMGKPCRKLVRTRRDGEINE
ncbi:MAG TPA: AMP-binding protein [Bacillota bacterium]|nr:AMP-binding protein [Bacillota bacterium]HNU93388.1 AMP-binding protein [Bacillota bacterium]HNY67160.1 AMP-binding protein [Bacillota bacterium]HOI36455.1 AMP-binding protein [Bacillota bacterium]HPU74548.1 AMP-binding protein [Bacillota bacterium]